MHVLIAPVAEHGTRRFDSRFFRYICSCAATLLRVKGLEQITANADEDFVKWQYLRLFRLLTDALLVPHARLETYICVVYCLYALHQTQPGIVGAAASVAASAGGNPLLVGSTATSARWRATKNKQWQVARYKHCVCGNFSECAFF